jgi:hypothetical protein
MREPLIPSDRRRPGSSRPSPGRRAALVAAILVVGVSLIGASTAAARPTQGAGTALRGSGAVLQRQPSTWESDGLGWSGAVAAGAFVGLMAVVLGRTYRSARPPITAAARRGR